MAKRRGGGRSGVAGTWLALLVPPLCAPVAWGESSSPSYTLRQSVLAMTAGSATSQSYRLGASAGQCVSAGTTAGADLVLASGFFSDLAPGQVPVVLALGRNALDAQAADLFWSGNAPRYYVFAFEECSSGPGPILASTSERTLAGIATSGALTCFDVVPSLREREASRPRLFLDYRRKGDAREE